MQPPPSSLAASHAIETHQPHPATSSNSSASTATSPAELRLLIEVVARACKRISYRRQQGRARRRARQRRQRERAGRGAEEARRHRQRGADRGQRMGRPPGGDGVARRWKASTRAQPLPAGRVPAAVRPARRLDATSTSTSASAPSSRCCKQPADGRRERRSSEADFLQPGTQQVAAGYCVYGPQTTLVLTVGDGVAMFTLDREQGSWVLTQDDVRIPEDTKEFAINMSQHAPLGAAGEALHRRMPGRQAPARAARTSTCAGWPAWSPTCTAS